MICSWSRGGGRGGSSSDGGLAVFGAHACHVFQLTGVRQVVARLVLGQDFHQGAELQPPLVLGDPVTEEGNRKLKAVISHSVFQALRPVARNVSVWISIKTQFVTLLSSAHPQHHCNHVAAMMMMTTMNMGGGGLAVAQTARHWAGRQKVTGSRPSTD